MHGSWHCIVGLAAIFKVYLFWHSNWNGPRQEDYPCVMIRNYLLTTIRALFANRVHAAINLAGLTLGFSGVLLVVLWIQHERSYDRAHAAADRIYRVMTTYTPSDGAVETYPLASRQIADNIREHLPSAEAVTQIAASDRWPNTLCFKHGKDSPAECVYRNGIYADDNFFTTFSFPIVQGAPAPFSEAMNITVSQRMAAALFAGRDPVGKHVYVDNWLELTVAGVFKDVPGTSSLQFDFVMPFTVFRKLRGISNDNDWQQNYLDTYLKTFTKEDTQSLASHLNAADIRPRNIAEGGEGFAVQALTDVRLYNKWENGKASGGRIAYVQLFGLIGAVVLIMACINFVNLATARSVTRSKEIGVRKVIGARRRHLVFQFMGESFVMVLLSFVMSLVIVQLLLPAFGTLIGEALTMNLFAFPLPYLLVAIVLAVSILAGLYPALVMSAFNPVRALKNKFTQPGSANVLRKSLMVVQVSASAVLIIFASVLFLQLDMIGKANLGYDRSHIIRVEPTFGLLKKFDTFRAELLRQTGMEDASLANGTLLDINFSTDVVSWPGKNPDETVPFKVMSCGYNFVETFGISLVEGRSFQQQDSTDIQYILLTESAVKKMGLANPVGAHIKLYDGDAEVVGVVKDVHGQSLHHTVEPTIFTLSQRATTMNALYVRYNGDAQAAIENLKKTYGSFEKNFSMVYWFFDDSFDKQYKSESVTGTLTIVFTLMAIGIALLGILGLSTYTVLRRLREVGVRKVFGASAAQIVALLSEDFVRLVVVSSVVACPVGYYLADRWLSGFAYRVSIPWWVFVMSFATVLVLTLITIGGQSLRAAWTNPSDILKDE